MDPNVLVVSADPCFVLPAAVTIASAWTCTGPLPTVVLGFDLTLDDERELHQRVARAHPDHAHLLHVEHVPSELFDGLDGGGVGSRASWSRVFVGRYTGNARRALYLDADMVVRRDLSPLLATDLEGYTIGAVADRHITSVADPYWRASAADWRDLDIRPTTAVFNAGLMLIDVTRWNEEDIEARTVKRGRARTTPALLAEMGELNTVLWDRWLPLDPAWHGQSVPGYVVHYLGRPKPWELGSTHQPRLLAQYRIAARAIGWDVPGRLTLRCRQVVGRAQRVIEERGPAIEALLGRGNHGTEARNSPPSDNRSSVPEG